MSYTASLYVQYKEAERKAFSELFPEQSYVDWKLSQWHDHLPLYLDPQKADEVIKNIKISIELRGRVANKYATELKTPKDSSSHEYFMQFLRSLVRAVRLLPAGPTNDESLNEAGSTNVVHEGPCGLQTQMIDTGDESLCDESLDSLDRLIFQKAVQAFMLEASENWEKAGRKERPLSAASIMSNMQATELHAFLAQAELLHPSWFESQDWVSWHMEDPGFTVEELIIPIMKSGLTGAYLPVPVRHLVESHTEQKGTDNKSLHYLIWRGFVDASIKAVDSSDLNEFRKIVQQKVRNMLRLALDHQEMIAMPPDISQTVSQLLIWAQDTSHVLSIGQIAELAEVLSVVVYRMILELPSITMFAYLCEYTRIEERQSLHPLLENWFTDPLLTKCLWWNGRPQNLSDWNLAVTHWVLAGIKGVVVAERRHQETLSRRIISAEYRCHKEILQELKQQHVSDCLERELSFPDTDRIRACIFDVVSSILGYIGSEWGTADTKCALRMYQQCRPNQKAQLVVQSFLRKWSSD
ncbi:hypothetical protein LY78DRAFT_726392 [Colletotrichum sublineola]|uniref:Uncharacterized protein n=1 Tax=Colletotrichum sublineola TaxID=1173701 RepID=A0A066XSG0_COLSU|nr:hypothetical protein LY78DRAFT_726392 [Colletotrichum sublineola]KDN68930.1 hypothetical protein CSUB01_11628 [Colletotrichum sublineola]